jgi:dTDP-4-dehydrorhamnose 3,5-epimerase
MQPGLSPSCALAERLFGNGSTVEARQASETEGQDCSVIVHQTDLPGVLVLEPKLFRDERGFFMESYNRARFSEAVGRDVEFVQDNHSRSSRGVLRGLHYQLPPRAQGKLVRAIAGEIFDVAVDIRRSSPNFGKWTGVHLSAENCRQLWVPAGFAHGFLVISDVAEVLYKASDYYSPTSERSIAWNDSRLAIDWPAVADPTLAPKDASAPLLAIAETFA